MKKENQRVKYYYEETFSDLYLECGEKATTEEAIKFLVKEVAKLKAEVYKPNTIKFIKDRDSA